MTGSSLGANSLPSKTRVCRCCGTTDSVVAFTPKENICVPCRRIYARDWYRRHPGKGAEYSRKRYDCPAYKERARNNWIKSTYGITAADRERMREEQKGKCLICKTAPIGKWWHGLVIDHCHATGRVRGLLCKRCNINLGWFEKFHNDIKKYLKE